MAKRKGGKPMIGAHQRPTVKKNKSGYSASIPYSEGASVRASHPNRTRAVVDAVGSAYTTRGHNTNSKDVSRMLNAPMSKKRKR